MNPNNNSNNNINNNKSDSSNPLPHEDVINLYHKMLPSLRKVVLSRWKGSARAKDLTARIKEDERHKTLDFWSWFFESVKKNPHWMGENERGWTADLGWLLKRANFDKVIERGLSN